MTIVLPAYNEEDAIGSTIERTLKAKSVIEENTFINKVTVVVVSDGSSDRTEEIAKSFEGITVVAYSDNQGYGAAIKTGFAQTEDEFVSFLDADGTCDPEFFVNMLNHQQETNADIVLGSRLGKDSQMPKIRRIGNVLFATLVNFWAGTKIKDTASGMRIIRRSVLPKLSPLPDSLHFTPAMSSKALFNKRIIIEEIPMSYSERVGKSKLNVLKDGILFLRAIVEAAITYKPKRAFNSFGLFLLLMAILLAYNPVTYYFSVGTIETDMIYRLITIAILINVGILMLGIGFVSQRFLDLLHYKKLVNIGTLHGLEQMFLNKGILTGVLLLIVSFVICIGPVIELFQTGQISAHWAYILVGCLLFATGFQLITFGVMGLISNILVTNYKDKELGIAED